MAYSFSTNQSFADIAHGFYAFMNLLVSAGWSVVSSGDGLLLYSSTDNILTGGGSGNGGLGNPSAWFRVQSPAVSGQTREYIVQRTNNSGGYTDLYWAIKYSASAGFTGGSPSATVVPTATDEFSIFGNIVGSSTSYDYLWQPGYPPPRSHLCAGGSTEKYSFYMFLAMQGTISGPYTFWALDALQSALSADTDPAVSYFARIGTDGVCHNDLLNQYGPCLAWMGNSVQAVRVTHLSEAIPAGMGVNVMTGLDDAIPLFWYRTSLPYGVKGWSTLFMWNTVGRACLDTLSIVNSADHLYLNGCLLPWDGSVPLV